MMTMRTIGNLIMAKGLRFPNEYEFKTYLKTVSYYWSLLIRYNLILDVRNKILLIYVGISLDRIYRII